MENRVRWYDQPDDSEAKPQAWFYERVPCAVLAFGVRDDRAVAVRLRTRDGDVKEIFFNAEGEWPGVEYQVYEHTPGNA